jgi:hypothetical protein
MIEQELDELYTELCRRIDAAGEGRGELYLARLALLLMGELGDRARSERAIIAAAPDAA